MSEGFGNFAKVRYHKKLRLKIQKRIIMNKRIIKFSETGLKQLHLFANGISFPVVVAAYTEQDIGKLSYLIHLVQNGDIRNTYTLCRWCIRQDVAYQILFHVTLRTLVCAPIRVYDYLRLQRILKKLKEETVGYSE